MHNHMCVCLFKTVNLLSDWSQNPLWVFLLLFPAEAHVYIQNSSTTGPTFPVLIVDFFPYAIYSAGANSDKVRASGEQKKVSCFQLLFL